MWRRLWDRLSLGHLRWIALGVVLAASAAFGGLDRADHVKPVALSGAYIAGPLKITPRSVSAIDYLPNLPELPADCRYLVLAVAIENTARETVPLQPINSQVDPDLDCHSVTAASPRNVFELRAPTSNYIGVFRGSTFDAIPIVEPGFTYDYSVVWIIPAADSGAGRTFDIRIYEMAPYVSTFRIARDWARTETIKYAELRGEL